MGRLEAVSGNARKMSAYFQSLFFYLGIVFYWKSIIFVVAKLHHMIKKTFPNNKPGERLRNAILPLWCSFAAPGDFLFSKHAELRQTTQSRETA